MSRPRSKETLDKLASRRKRCREALEREKPTEVYYEPTVIDPDAQDPVDALGKCHRSYVPVRDRQRQDRLLKDDHE